MKPVQPTKGEIVVTQSIQRSIAAAAGSFVIAGSAAAQTSFGVGAEYTTGKYGGTEKTDTLYVPFVVKHETGPWMLKATIPYLRNSGPGNVVGAGADRVTLPGASSARRTESGLGDIVASAFYTLRDERSSGLGVDAGLKVKLPTADEAKGLGTGEMDYALQADFFKPLDSALTVFGSLGYRWYGDPPGVSLRNVPYGALGLSRRMSAETTVGVAWDYRPRITSGGAAISEATAFWSQRLSREWKLQLYGVVGFSDGSPDGGIGALLDYRFQ
jgi:hypothetical protein